MISKAKSLINLTIRKVKSIKNRFRTFYDAYLTSKVERRRNFENIIKEGIDTSAEELLEMRKEEDFSYKKREEIEC